MDAIKENNFKPLISDENLLQHVISAASVFCEASGTTAYLKAAEEHDVRGPDQVAQPGSEV